MANIKAEKKLSILQSLYDAIRLNNINDFLGVDPAIEINTLELALMWFQQGLFNNVRTGKIAIASSGYQLTSVSFERPQVWRDFIPDELLGVAQQFREIYADAKITAAARQAPSAVTDDCILADMMADSRLETVTISHTDYAGIRLPWSHLS